MSAVPEDYSEAKWAELRSVSEKMRTVPEVAEAIAARRAFVLTCPRGHKITTVELEDDGDTITARPIAELGRESGAAAVADTPFRAGKTVCRSPRCPNLVERDGWCAEHGGRQATTVDRLATRYTCPAATAHGGKKWSDRVTAPRLLKVMTAAIVAGTDRVPVSGHIGVSSRR